MASTSSLTGMTAPLTGPALDPKVLRFACVGVGSTLLHLSLFAGLLAMLDSSQAANLGALTLATVANTAVNRRWTFGIRGTTTAARHHVQALAIFGLTWGLSTLALWLLHTSLPSPPAVVQVFAVGLSMLGSTAVRYVAMTTWIFGSRR